MSDPGRPEGCAPPQISRFEPLFSASFCLFSKPIPIEPTRWLSEPSDQPQTNYSTQTIQRGLKILFSLAKFSSPVAVFFPKYGLSKPLCPPQMT